MATLATAAVASVAVETSAPRIQPKPTARAYAPGEIVRFEVVTDDAVTKLGGSFFEAELTFVASTHAPGETIWVGWGVIPLEAKPGDAGYALSATRDGGASLSISGRLPVEAKSFPEQRLGVASKYVNPPKAAAERIAREQATLGTVYARRTPLPPAGEPFVRPVPGEPTSEFGTRRIFNGEPRSPHPGLDLRAKTGTPVLAAGPGTIVLAADLYYSGGTVIVDHGGGLFTIYAHLSKIEAKDGATVRAGERVGLSGATGRVTGPHLHWGARVGSAIFDPRALLDPRLFGGG
jgi:murein DD-endopeptidase MepM/ murein hydrolase activator NlpD